MYGYIGLFCSIFGTFVISMGNALLRLCCPRFAPTIKTPKGKSKGSTTGMLWSPKGRT